MTLPFELLSDPLNEYGDRMVDTTGRHGADIASQRADWLDVSSALFAAADAAFRRLPCGRFRDRSGSTHICFVAFGRADLGHRPLRPDQAF